MSNSSIKAGLESYLALKVEELREFYGLNGPWCGDVLERLDLTCQLPARHGGGHHWQKVGVR